MSQPSSPQQPSPKPQAAVAAIDAALQISKASLTNLGLATWKNAESYFQILCTTRLWYREHRHKSDRGKPKNWIWLSPGLGLIGREAEELPPYPEGTQSTHTVAIPVHSAVPRDVAGCHVSAIDTYKPPEILLFFFK